ncbi:MAG: hypothetical protein ACRCXL_01880 [Dermatophilaceae bacterium]
MSAREIREVIETQAKMLGPVLHAGAATSLAASEMRCRGLGHDMYPHLRPLTMRAEMREHLERDRLPHGWAVGGNPGLMGQLLLNHADLDLEMRFLKERRRAYPGGVPVAGSNGARRGRWVNDPLDLMLPAQPADAAQHLPLLLLWDFTDPRVRDEFTLRIVHTLAPGIYGRAVPCDLIVDVQDGGTIFSHLRFPGSPEDDDFFVIEVAEEDEHGS